MRILFLSILLPLFAAAHPGTGIVKDSKGNIYYTDLQNVWRLDVSGNKTIAVANVHTHQLFIDNLNQLYGEQSWYEGDATKRFNHFLWKYSNGILDTVTKTTQAYVSNDFSLIRDNSGAEYFVSYPLQNSIVKKGADGSLKILAEGDFKDVQFMLPVQDGIYFISKGNIYFADNTKQVKKLTKAHIGGSLFGLWQDEKGAIYTGHFEEQKVLRIDLNGNKEDFYTCKNGWSPTGGVFDKEGNLWLLECNKQNEVRVEKVEASRFLLSGAKKSVEAGGFSLPLLIATVLAVFVAFIFIKKRKR